MSESALRGTKAGEPPGRLTGLRQPQPREPRSPGGERGLSIDGKATLRQA